MLNLNHDINEMCLIYAVIVVNFEHHCQHNDKAAINLSLKLQVALPSTTFSCCSIPNWLKCSHGVCFFHCLGNVWQIRDDNIMMAMMMMVMVKEGHLLLPLHQKRKAVAKSNNPQSSKNNVFYVEMALYEHKPPKGDHNPNFLVLFFLFHWFQTISHWLLPKQNRIAFW